MVRVRPTVWGDVTEEEAPWPWLSCFCMWAASSINCLFKKLEESFPMFPLYLRVGFTPPMLLSLCCHSNWSKGCEAVRGRGQSGLATYKCNFSNNGVTQMHIFTLSQCLKCCQTNMAAHHFHQGSFRPHVSGINSFYIVSFCCHDCIWVSRSQDHNDIFRSCWPSPMWLLW